MDINRKEPAMHLLELICKMKYFTKLKPEDKNDNSFNTNLKVSSYIELNQMITSLLKTSISTLRNNTSESKIDTMILLEIALQLLPNDEMELLDELYNMSVNRAI